MSTCAVLNLPLAMLKEKEAMVILTLIIYFLNPVYLKDCLSACPISHISSARHRTWVRYVGQHASGLFRLRMNFQPRMSSRKERVVLA